MGLTKFSLLKRRHDISHEQFLMHWHTVHVDVLVSRGRHRHYNLSYIQNDFQGQCPDDDLLFDGAAQMVPRSSQFVSNGFQQDPLYAQYVRPDEELFLTPGRCVVLYCQSSEFGQMPVSKDQRKILCLVRRSPGTHADEFSANWDVRARDLLSGPADRGLLGIRQHSVLPGSATNMGDGLAQGQPIELVEEFFFKSDDTLYAFLRSNLFMKSFHDHGAMNLNEGSHVFVAQERLVYEDQ